MGERRATTHCRCGGPCFYCGDDLPGAHDHDHFPIPWRHGGRATVPTCRRCHILKDSTPLERWAPAGLEAVAIGLDDLPEAFVSAFADIVNGTPLAVDPGDAAEAVFAWVPHAKTPEARIALAKTFAAILDRDARARGNG